jgi:erythromycin esterase-like protein
MSDDHRLLSALDRCSRPFSGASRDLLPLLDLTRGARCVLIGEASHGTHEFYTSRAELTRRLIVEQGFTAVVAEADWPDAYRVNRYVRGEGADADAEEALRDFRRFPAWMWRNSATLDFVGWLRTINERRAHQDQVGFYGLDLYSLHSSMDAVLAYLDRADPEAAGRARERYACFDHFERSPEGYGYGAYLGLSGDCERQVVNQLLELRQQRERLLRRDGLVAADEYFHAEQNARVVKNAEQYYRALFAGRTSSWNLRDGHMADTLDALLGHLGNRRSEPKIVVWAHNSHVGDARATEVGDEGELNVGQLCRQRYPESTVLIGFSTHSGTVMAAADWGQPPQRMQIRPALPGSYEDLFHQLIKSSFLLLSRDVRAAGPALAALDEPRLQRAIGVVYRPQSERASHYYHARLCSQFDALIHIDRTRALEPLERKLPAPKLDVAETYPSGL